MTDLYADNFPHMSPVWGRIFDLVADRAEGSYIFTADGRKLLDFTCGIGVTNTGHCHPKVVEAIREQAGSFIHAQANIVVHKPMLSLIEELRQIVPPPIDGFFFSNSGAEAIEGAVKLSPGRGQRVASLEVVGQFGIEQDQTRSQDSPVGLGKEHRYSATQRR